jgi:antitoxin component YwqK of YwqJK toxin-antitoxin module
METVHLNQLTRADGGAYFFDGIPFSGFAIETFPDGKLQTQMSLMHGLQDGVTRRWHSNGQLESEQSFRNGIARGKHHQWHPDGILKAESTWNAGECVHARQFDEQGRPILEMHGRPRGDPQTVAYH